MRGNETYERRRRRRGEGEGETLVDVDGGDVEEAAREEGDDVVGGERGADAESGAAETLEVEPSFADEGAGVAGGFRIESLEDLEDEFVGQPIVYQITTSHVPTAN